MKRVSETIEVPRKGRSFLVYIENGQWHADMTTFQGTKEKFFSSLNRRGIVENIKKMK
jgi:hypothetical protein